MNLAVIGSGGREHAICYKLKQSPKIKKLICIPGNAGTEKIAENIKEDISDFKVLYEVIKKKNIDIVIIGPEQPLVDGIVDYLESNKEVLFRISKVGDIINTQEEIKNSAQILVDNATFYVALKGIINIEEELNRLNRDLNKLKNDVSIIDNKLSNKNFINKAPKEVIKEQNSKKDVFENKILRLQAAINKLK